ncbi:hypothetical protein [Sulfitobacter sp.]|uniref:hypothetical protein n=1 Tax=Sulfitobacter sp. TaxID=1903071 RepID=UPI003001E0A9
MLPSHYFQFVIFDHLSGAIYQFILCLKASNLAFYARKLRCIDTIYEDQLRGLVESFFEVF